MNCSIKRHSKNNKIVEVLNAKGNPSKLFNDIHSNIFLSDTDLSLRIYLHTMSLDGFNGVGEHTDKDGEPMLHYRSPNGTIHNSLEEAIIHDTLGETVMGVVNQNTLEFVPVAKFDSSTSEKSRFLHDQVLQGILSADRYLDKETGETRFKGKGEFFNTRLATVKAAQFEAAVELGVGQTYPQKDGTIRINFPNDLIEIETEDGTSAIHIKDVPKQLQENKEIQNKTSVLLAYAQRFLNPRKLTKGDKPVQNILTEDNLRRNLMNFLKGIGFTTTTLDNYVKNYNTKYGNDPDVLALTDMANKVAAFAKGDMRIEDLSEEVAHIAIEAYNDQNSITEALMNVHLTQEYRDNAEFYRNKYEPFYEGFALEEQVRKEILGKILAKQLQKNFKQNENVSPEESSLLDKLRNIWNVFTTFIKSRVRMGNIKALQQLNDKIANSILTGSQESFKNDIEQNDNFFYSAMDRKGQKVETTLKIIKVGLDDLFAKTLEGSKPKYSDLEKISDVMEEHSIVSSVNTIISIANNQLSELEVALREAKAKSTPDKVVLIAETDAKRFALLNDNLLPVLLKLNSQIRKVDFSPTYEKNIKESIEAIESINNRFGKITPDVNEDNDKYVEQLIEKSLSVGELTEEQKQVQRDSIKGGFEDLTFLGKWFGLVTHSKNILMGALAQKVSEMQAAATRIFKKLADIDINNIYNKGLQKFQQGIVQPDSFYYRSMIDYEAYDKDLKQQELKILSETLQMEIPEVEKALGKSSIAELISDEAKYQKFKSELDKWKKEEGLEQRFNNLYYEEQKELFDNVLKISEATKEYLKNQNSVQYNIDRKYRNPDNTIDRSRYTEEEKIQLANAQKSKRVVRSAYDNTGNVRLGLKVVKLKDYQGTVPYEKLRDTYPGDVVVLDDGYTVDMLSEDARTAYDLNNLAMKYAEKAVTEGLSKGAPLDAFKEEIANIEKNGGNAYEWVMANASINPSDKYFESIGSTEGYEDQVRKYAASIPDQDMADMILIHLENYLKTQRHRKDLLKKNRKGNSSMEIDVNGMVGNQKLQVLLLDSEIEETRRSIGLPQEFSSQDKSEKVSSKGLNEDYEKLRIESGKSHFDFILSHLSPNQETLQSRIVQRLNNFSREITNIIEGKSFRISKANDAFFKEVLTRKDENGNPLITSSMTNAEIIQTLKDEFAKKNAPSYFQRYAPVGYDSFNEALKDSSIKMSELFDEQAKQALAQKHPIVDMLEITPDYSWSADLNTEKYFNENYYQGGYYLKPKVSKYLNKKHYFDHYGINPQEFHRLSNEGIDPMDLNNYTPTKNTEEFELLKTQIGWREKTLELYNDTEQKNKFLRPQITSNNFEKLARPKNWVNVGAIKDFAKDIIENRIDEKNLGEQVDGINLMASDVRIIPKYFHQKVEDVSSLTENIISAGLLDLHQAIKYSEKKKIERDMQAIQISIANQNYTNNSGIKGKLKIDKKGQVSSYHEKAKEYNNYHLYGVRQTSTYIANVMGKEVDVSRVINKVQAATRFSNLGYNAFVDLTSLTTGLLNNAIDRVAGDYYHKSSASRANKEWLALMGSYIAEAGTVNKTSTMHQIIEFCGIEDVDSRIKNSKFGRGLRLIEKSPYLLSKLCNMPVTPKTLLALMNDMRYSDGQFRTFNQYYQNQKFQFPTLTKKDIEAKWATIEKDSFRDNLEITPTSIGYNQRFLDKFGGDVILAEQEFEKLHQRVTAMSKQVIEGVDGVVNEIDQVAAQRDTLMNLLMLHKGWLLLNMTRRFKKTHFNTATGQIEEGHYISLWKFFKGMPNAIRTKQGFKDYYESLSPAERRNIKRSGVETGIMAMLLLVGQLVLGSDDDDDTYLEDLAQLIYIRTVSEYNSAQLPGIEKSIIETAKSPFTAINTIEALGPFTALQRVISEDSEGKNKLVKALTKISPLRRVPQYQDLQGTLKDFLYFNQPTLPTLSGKKD